MKLGHELDGDEYFSVRPARYVEPAACGLEDGGADAELPGGLGHGEVEVARQVAQLQIARPLPLPNQINQLMVIRRSIIS